MSINDYIDRRTKQILHETSLEKQHIQDTVSGGRRDSTGMVDPRNPRKVIVPSGQTYDLIKAGTPGAVDTTVRINNDAAVMVEEGNLHILVDGFVENWYMFLFDPASTPLPIAPGPWITNNGWWLKRTDSDKAYRLPFELIATHTDPEYQALNIFGSIAFDAMVDDSGQHLILLKFQRKSVDPFNTDYLGLTYQFPGPPLTNVLPANPIAVNQALQVDYVVLKNFTFDDDTLEVISDDQVSGSFEVDNASGYQPRPDTYVPPGVVLAYRLTPRYRIQSIGWSFTSEGDDLILRSISELYAYDFLELNQDNGNGDDGYRPSDFGSGTPFRTEDTNPRKHYIYQKRILAPTTPTIDAEYGIDTGSILPFLGFTEHRTGFPTYSGFSISHGVDRIYCFNGSFLLDFGPISPTFERRMVFFDNDQTNETFAMSVVYSASGFIPSEDDAPPHFNISHAAYSSYTDIPVTVPVPEYADEQASNVLVQTIDEETLSVIENVSGGNSDFLFYPPSIKKMTYNSDTSQWELGEEVSNTALADDFVPAGLVYRNRLAPSGNRAIMSRIFRAQ